MNDHVYWFLLFLSSGTHRQAEFSLICRKWPIACREVSLSWQAALQIFWNKRKCLHNERVEFPQDWFGTPTWLPCDHVKTLYTYNPRADLHAKLRPKNLEVLTKRLLQF